jgi:hypothetical protein
MSCGERCFPFRFGSHIAHRYASYCLGTPVLSLATPASCRSLLRILLPLLAEPILPKALLHRFELIPRYLVADAAFASAAFLGLKADAPRFSVFELDIYFQGFFRFHSITLRKQKGTACLRCLFVRCV